MPLEYKIQTAEQGGFSGEAGTSQDQSQNEVREEAVAEQVLRASLASPPSYRYVLSTEGPAQPRIPFCNTFFFPLKQLFYAKY